MSRHRTYRLAQALLLAVSVSTAACGSIPWGNGGLGDAVNEASYDPHGIVLALGPDAVTASAVTLTEHLYEAVGDGLAMTGTAALDALEVLSVDFAAVVLNVGAIELESVERGVNARVVVEVEAVEITVDDGFTSLCSPIVTIDRGVLSLSLSLVTDKQGRVKSELRADPGLTATAMEIDWASCALGVESIDLDGWTQQLWHAFAQAAADALGEIFVHDVPVAMGVDIAAGLASTVSADEIGTGVFRLSTQALDRDSSANRWSVSEAGIRVPFAAAIEVDRHPCAPVMELAPVKAIPLDEPIATGGRTLAVAVGFVRRALQVAWQSGALCGDNLTGGASANLDATTMAGWVGERLPRDTAFGLKLWPRGLPTLEVTRDDEGVALFMLASGPVDIDIYAVLDDAEVRLASVAVDVTVDFGVTTTQEGWLLLAIEAIEVGQRGGHPGLYEVPQEDAIRALLTPMLLGLLTDLPLLSLPPGPGFQSGPVRVTASRSHLVIGW